MALSMRPYQTDIKDECRAKMMAGHRRIIVVAPTGAGKTVIVSNMMGSAADRGLRAWFIVHRRELVKQSIAAFHKSGVSHGVCASGFAEDYRHNVTICSIQTLAKRMTKMMPPDLIIWDECHHIAAGTWERIFNMFPKAFHVGLTATPVRLDGRGLGKYFSEMVMGPTVEWLIENKFLCDYKIFAPTNVDLSGVKRSMGDYQKAALEDVLDDKAITGSAISEYKRRCSGKRAVVFCVTVQHSKNVVDQFNEAGIPAMHVDGSTHADQRDYAIRMFASGKIKVLSNVELFGEGFDLPSIEAAILLRPTQSLSLYRQQVGRILRPVYADGYDLESLEGRSKAMISGGKGDAIILDHVGNVKKHGLPDEDIEWSLDESQISKNKKSEVGVKICKVCFAAQKNTNQACSECGAPFEKKERELEFRDGELQELDKNEIKKKRTPDQIKRSREQAQAQTQEELYQLGLRRGMKNPRGWAKHVFNARQAKKIRGQNV